jgi:hypothetical protein
MRYQACRIATWKIPIRFFFWQTALARTMSMHTSIYLVRTNCVINVSSKLLPVHPIAQAFFQPRRERRVVGHVTGTHPY